MYSERLWTSSVSCHEYESRDRSSFRRMWVEHGIGFCMIFYLSCYYRKNRLTEVVPRSHTCLRCTEHLVCVVSLQYSFIYQALLEYFLYGDTELDVSSLEGHLDKLHNTSAPLDRVGLEEEFKVRKLVVCNCLLIWFWQIINACLTLALQKLTNMRIWRRTWGWATCLPTWRRTESFRLFHVSLRRSKPYKQT